MPRRRRYRSNSLAMASPLASGRSAVSWASSRLSTYSATSLSEDVESLEEAQDTADLPEASGDAIAKEFERYLRRRGTDES